jgi:hypothetical protein
MPFNRSTGETGHIRPVHPHVPGSTVISMFGAEHRVDHRLVFDIYV